MALSLCIASGPVPAGPARTAALNAALAVFTAHDLKPVLCFRAALSARRGSAYFDRRRSSCWYAAELAALAAYWPSLVDRPRSARLVWVSPRG